MYISFSRKLQVMSSASDYENDLFVITNKGKVAYIQLPKPHLGESYLLELG